MSDSRLTRRLDVVAVRLQRLRRHQVLCGLWMAAGAICLLLAWAGVAHFAWWLAALACIPLAATMWLAPRPTANARQTAARIEQRFPELNAALITAAAQAPNPDTGRYGYLQEQVLSDVLVHARQRDWSQSVPSASLWGWRAGHALSFAAFCAAAVLAWQSPAETHAVPVGGGAPLAAVGEATEIDVEPVDVELERGASLLVLARFRGPLPADVTLVTLDASQESQHISLAKSLDDPLFGGRIPGVRADLAYHVEFDGRRSETFRVRTFEYPALLKADAHIQPPGYTGLEPQLIEDVRRVSLVEGSTLTLTCRLNKPVASAVLSGDDGESLPLSAAASPGEVLMSATFQPLRSGTYRLELLDESGRANKDRVQFRIEVVPNQPPELAVTFPSRDMQVSALEELNLEARVWDDFGIREHGIVFAAADGLEQAVVLGESAPSARELQLAHVLALEALNAGPRDLLSYYFYADDIGPDGEARRTFSDIFFAEVRYFDEEYRELPGQASQQQQQQRQQQQQQLSGQGSQAQQIGELQRQVVSATWNLIRRWPGSRIAPHEAQFTEDAGVIAESQAQVRALAGELAGQLEDPAAQQHAADAVRHMETAEAELARAAADVSTDPLTPARTAEQAAYQALLRLQERLHIVQLQEQQQQQSSSSSSSSSSQNLDRQLNELELNNNRNRYEQEQQAQQQQQAQNREEQQVLNRLRELAQRQEDLNERIAVEDELRNATQERRAELERELKRLQEDQQELRDVDELNERMEQPQNQRDMAESRQQLEQTRENIRNATEALQEGQTSRALTSGTRAERELEELRDEFRRRTAGNFADVMQQLREDVQELADREQELSRQLTENEQPAGRPSLRDTDRREELSGALDEQRERLGDLLDRMRDVVQQSEDTEPLLSSQLYDAMRGARVDQPEEALEIASQLLRRGFPQESAAAEAQARQGIERIQQGVERAAESVLGDETEALRRAERQLAQLAESVQNELDQLDPEGRQPRSGRSTTPGEPSEEEGESSRRSPGSAEGDESESAGRSGSRGDREEQTGQRPSGASRGEDGMPGETPDGERPGNRGDPSPMPGEGNSPSPEGEQGEGEQPAGQRGRQGQGDREGQQSEGEREGQRGEGQRGEGQRGEGQQPGEGQRSQQGQGQQGEGEQRGRNGQGGNRGTETDPDSPASSNPFAPFFPTEQQTGGQERGGGSGGPYLPLTGDEFLEWSDRMRDVEEMLSDPALRAEAAAIRERARDIRIDVKRHSQAPDWELVRTSVYGPMLELQRRVAEEVARRTQSDELVPIDRDPVPDRYADLVREYYERLSTGPAQ